MSHSYRFLEINLKVAGVYFNVILSWTVILGAVLSVASYGSSGSKVPGNGFFVIKNFIKKFILHFY